jgi:hypothetical protein
MGNSNGPPKMGRGYRFRSARARPNWQRKPSFFNPQPPNHTNPLTTPILGDDDGLEEAGAPRGQLILGLLWWSAHHTMADLSTDARILF